MSFALLLSAAFIALANEAATQQAETATIRRALLVGIEAYPGGPGWPPLQGTRADVDAVRAALIERAGFEAGNVQVLLDEQATRQAILDEFARLAKACGKDDMLLFYFAGHGSQLPDQETEEGELADELDDFDETLIPFDTKTANGQPNDIRDDDVRDMIRVANEQTKNVVLVFDCCSSGTNTRGELEEVSRFVAPEARGLAGTRKSSQRKREPGSGYSVAGNELSYVSLSACRANESAWEFRLPTESGDPGPARGLFTYSLLQELYSTSQPTSYLDLMDRVRRRVRQVRPQTPVIDGPLDRNLAFHGGLVVRPHAYRIDATAEEASLRGGLVNGLRLGTELDVYPDEGSLDDPAQRMGTIRLDEVGATSSRFSWLDQAPAKALEDSWCAVPARPGSARTSVGFSIDGTGPQAGELAQALRRAPLLHEAHPQEAAFHLRRVREGDTERWQTFTPNGNALPMQANVDADDEVHALATSLGRLGTLYSVRADLQNEVSAYLKVNASLERIDQRGRSAGELHRDDSGMLQARHGDRIRASLVNDSPVPVYASLIVLSPDGEIGVVSRPANEDDRIAPGTTVRTQTLKMQMHSASQPFYLEGVEHFRWIVTTQYHDVRSLEQRSITQASTLRSASAERAKNLDLDDADLLLTRTIEVRLLPKD